MKYDPKYGSRAEIRILERARQLIIEKGWAKHAMGVKSPDSNGNTLSDYRKEEATNYCLVGALRKAGEDHGIPYFSPTGCSIPFFNLTGILWDTTPETRHGIEYWNDCSDITATDVIAAIDRALSYLWSLETEEAPSYPVFVENEKHKPPPVLYSSYHSKYGAT